MRSAMRICFVLLLLLWSGEVLFALSPEFAGSQPVLTLDELLERLEVDSGEGLASAVGQTARLGPDYAWLLADLLDRDDLSPQAGLICKALARNGNEESLLVLREAVVDTALQWSVRERAISALAYARDRESVSLLQDVSKNCDNAILAQAASDAILHIESPGYYRPLIEIEGGRLYFGFLLDDVEAIEYTESPEVTHRFARADFRVICDLFQSGLVRDASGSSAAGALTFRLNDGGQVSVPTDGLVYGRISGRFVESPGLRRLIWSGLGRESEEGEPHN